MELCNVMSLFFLKYYSHTQARAKLPKKRRRVVNVDLPQAAQNKGRGRGPAANRGKAGLGQKMGKSKVFCYVVLEGIPAKRPNLFP